MNSCQCWSGRSKMLHLGMKRCCLFFFFLFSFFLVNFFPPWKEKFWLRGQKKCFSAELCCSCGTVKMYKLLAKQYLFYPIKSSTYSKMGKEKHPLSPYKLSDTSDTCWVQPGPPSHFRKVSAGEELLLREGGREGGMEPDNVSSQVFWYPVLQE